MKTMRKSRYVTLLLAGAAATTLAGCDQGPPPQDMTLYGDTAACARENTPEECDAAFAVAKEQHIKEAPKFATKEECEAAGFTQCEAGQVQTAQGGSGSMFMPMMMGYMMGRMLGGGMGGGAGMGGGPATQRQPGAATASRPVYGDRNGFLYSGGSNVGRVAPGTTSLGSQGIAMRTTRGGFGGAARGFGGGS
jgi:uncharacterized protein YgiB involved in biofilm formation